MKKIYDKHIEQMKELYLQGESYTNIAKKLDCSTFTVKFYLKDFIKENPRNDVKLLGFSDEDIKAIEELYAKGVSYREISKETKHTFKTIKKYLNNFISENPRGKTNERKFTEKEISEMQKMYSDGVIYKNIAMKFNCSIPTIRKNLKEFIKNNPKPIKKKRNKKFLDKEIAQMKKMYIQGLSCEEIAKKFNCSYRTINRVLDNFIKENPRKRSKFSEKDAKIMKYMRDEGYKYREIAKIFDCSESTIRKTISIFKNND